MPYEIGGRADKLGNRFEVRWVIYQLMEILEEKIDYVILEALGDDERGIDVWIGKTNNTKEGQQCKGRNGSKEIWDFASVNGRGIFKNWKHQLDADQLNKVSLVSPLAFTNLEDLIERAKTNESPMDFYNNQILSSSKDFIKFFKNFCNSMDLNPDNAQDLIKSISYLRRILYRQIPDAMLKEIVLKKINYLFIGNEEQIYNTFVAWIIDGDIYGKELTRTEILKFLKDKEIDFRNLALDSRIVPRINELNQEYINGFYCIDNNLIYREEFDKCKEIINSEKSLIIHGKAGRGKSGCTLSIVEYCKEEKIPYLAIKLDRRVPNGSSEKWGKEIGLPASIAHCLHSVSKNEKAVLILDQLDALRWTQAHSRDALLVCAEVINQIYQLNLERKHKIAVVFVCRTYDLENDNNINSLFNDYRNGTKFEWSKVKVSVFTEDIVRKVIGDRYSLLTSKLQRVIQIPSNLFIWQQLSPQENYAECSSTGHLITKWWNQLERKCADYGLDVKEMNEIINQIVDWLEKKGRIYFPKNLINNSSYLEFLSSNEFLIIQDSKVFFAHQSILDNFFADKMLQKYFDEKNITEIVGEKDRQTPGKRYQVQMLMEKLLEFESHDFLDIGQKLFESKEVRYFIKFVFIEVLNQIEILDNAIQDFILDKCEDEMWSSYVINNVVFAKPQYVRTLREGGLLEKWFADSEKKKIVFNLLASISPDYNIEDINFIKKHAFLSEKDDEQFARCFSHDITQDQEDFFELRMKLYEKYPRLANGYYEFESALKKNEIRSVRILRLLLQNKLKNQATNNHNYGEDFFIKDSETLINKGQEVIEILLPCVPLKDDGSLLYSDWSEDTIHRKTLERACIQLIKKANAAIICSDPQLFWEKYKHYMGKNFQLFNEIILDGFTYMPKQYSDKIIGYLAENIGNNTISDTDNASDKLLLAKKVLAIHANYCDMSIYQQLESQIIHYTSPQAKDTYIRRIDFSKEEGNPNVYWSFWGDLQFELLRELPEKRLSKAAKELLLVLGRKFPNGKTKYTDSFSPSGRVKSSVSGKELPPQRWLEILTNKKLNHKKSTRWTEVYGGFTKNSLERFSDTFRDVVSKNTVEMIELVLSNKDTILEGFIDSWLSGIAYSDSIENISDDLLKKVLLCFPCDDKSQRARYFTDIIEKRRDIIWPQEILNTLIEIAINHKDPELGSPNITSKDDKEMKSVEMLQSNAINCVRGSALQAIGALLWTHDSLFENFKNTIEKLTQDENDAVKFATLYCLWPSYNLDREWTEGVLLALYEKDIRFAGFHRTRNMLFLLYPRYRQKVLQVIQRCFISDDERLIQIGSMSISEMFIVNNEFAEIIGNTGVLTEKQAEGILDIALLYFKETEYNPLVKQIILKFKKSSLNIEHTISRLFYDNLVDLDRDKDFLIEIVGSDLSRKLVHSFVRYLENESKSIIDFEEIILSMGTNIVQFRDKNNDYWGVEDEISKLIIGLYDETTNLKSPQMKAISDKCLDLWDLMYENQIGSIRNLSQKIMDR
ncbi:hypothetical protein G8B08_06465 [Enterococcus faecalis]|uniref:hypothetical protein n=1 Tax=Enterococcus TaxID=1350 RepID=UPI00188372CF|nr:hypothetical protein [Enterococcus faecalis]EHL0041969.1 hypothetical protein [Enterococcus faecalis]EJR1555808.1 hypothetical protein [Enterococcus faecalis]MBE9919720.1 hypothetical protein [Enterococcus faecalis]MCI0138793.1 hypothetical protein [Enterococcus faecalis]